MTLRASYIYVTDVGVTLFSYVNVANKPTSSFRSVPLSSIESFKSAPFSSSSKSVLSSSSSKSASLSHSTSDQTCEINLKSWSYDSQKHKGHIIINGKMVAHNNDRPGHRGFTIVVLSKPDCHAPKVSLSSSESNFKDLFL